MIYTKLNQYEYCIGREGTDIFFPHRFAPKVNRPSHIYYLKKSYDFRGVRLSLKSAQIQISKPARCEINSLMGPRLFFTSLCSVTEIFYDPNKKWKKSRSPTILHVYEVLCTY